MNELINNVSMEKQTKKRKRKTTDEQYELYLHGMEQDYIFRSGIINPTVGDDYILNKWKCLIQKLNCTGTGPQLSVEEWKRRFKDWKNATRAKYRKISESRSRTGGGPQLETKLTPLEERGLSVWGRVAVTGFFGIKESGLQQTTSNMDDICVNKPICSSELIINNEIINESEQITTNEVVLSEMINTPKRPQPFIEIATNLLDAYPNIIPNTSDNIVTDTENVQNISEQRNLNLKDKRNTPKRPQPFSEIATNLLDAYTNNSKTTDNIVTAIEKFTATYNEIERQKLIIENKKIKVEKAKLKFEISKYKFENPSFVENEDDFST